MDTRVTGGALPDRTDGWLARTPALLEAHVRGQSRESLDSRPGRGWSQTEILAHLADFEVLCFQARIERIVRGETIARLDPDGRAVEVPYAAINPLTAVDVFRRERARSRERLARLAPDDLARSGMHEERGRCTLDDLLTEWVAHDLTHLRQLAATAAAVFAAQADRTPSLSGPPEAAVHHAHQTALHDAHR